MSTELQSELKPGMTERIMIHFIRDSQYLPPELTSIEQAFKRVAEELSARIDSPNFTGGKIEVLMPHDFPESARRTLILWCEKKNYPTKVKKRDGFGTYFEVSWPEKFD